MKWIVLLLCVFLSGGASAEVGWFLPGEPHASQLDFRLYFKTMTAQTGACTISIQQSAYEEEAAAALYVRIAEDEAALADLAFVQPHTIYVVEELPAGLQRIGSAVYVTQETVMDGSYRPYLAEAAFGTERWKAVGLCAAAFGTQVDDTVLAAWYADNAHDDMLSLCPSYFVPEFASPEEMRMAEATAVSLAGYIMLQGGAQAVLSAEVSDYIPGWLAVLGIDRVYTDPYAGLLTGYTWGKNQYYALVATSPKGDVFKMNPLSYDMHTPAQVRRMLCERELAVEAIIAGVERDAPEFAPVLRQNYAAPITYEFNENGGNMTYTANRRIVLNNAGSIIHETVHMMTPCHMTRISRYMDSWKVEGLAEYLTLTYYPWIGEREEGLRSLQEGYVWIESSQDPQELAFWKAVGEIYLQHAPMPMHPQEVNVKLWYRATLQVRRELGWPVTTVSGVYGNAGSASLEEMYGNELTYTEAEWLTCWLVERYGLPTFMYYCMDAEDVTFQEAFGMTYAEAKTLWLAERSMQD